MERRSWVLSVQKAKILAGETLGHMLRKRLALAKFGMAALFAGLGVLVVSTA